MASEVNGLFVVAHELKAPVALMRQLALSIDFDNDSKEDLARKQNELITVSDNAIRQVNDLTKIARLNDGLFEMEPVAVRGVCDEVTRELRHLYRFNHRDIKEKYSNRSKLVFANREMLKSIIYNFVLNAMHYSTEGTHSVISVHDKKQKIEVEVRDFGPSLPNNIWKELQKGWVENPTSIAMRPGSSGLGLYIASRFGRAMNAEISATRHSNGTSFKIALLKSTQGSFFE